MRLIRRSTPGVLTHVICRFVDRSWMLSDDFERKTYLGFLEHALERTDWRCVSYALMSSHLHFGMIPGNADLQSWAKRVNSPFAQWLNHRHERLGPVFAERPAEWTIRTNQSALIAYIHNNPVRAHVARRAADSTWTSHQAYVGRAPRPPWLHVEQGMKICGFTSAQRREFDAWVDTTVNGTHELPDLTSLRAAVRGRGPIELATPVLADECEVPLVVAPNAFLRVPTACVLECALTLLDVDRGEICSASKKPATASARRVFIHAAQRLGTTASGAARQLGISPQAASRHLDAKLTTEQAVVVAEIVERLGSASSSGPSN